MKVTGEKTEYIQQLTKSPKYLMLEPTTKCNLNCVMCPHNEIEDIGDMDYGLFLKIMEQLPDVKTIKFQGLGETYLAADSIRMLEYCNKRSIDVVSISQCLWNHIDIPYLMTLLSHMYISYHAADEKTYMKICGGGNWELLHENIGRIVKNKGGCQVILNCVLFEENYDQASEIVIQARKMNVDNVRFQIMQNWTTERDESFERLNNIRNFDFIKITDSLKKAFITAKKESVSIELVGNSDFEYTSCIWPFERTYINKNGFVLPCHMRPLPKYYIGDLKSNRFDEIWNCDEINFIRNKLQKNEAPEMCIDCPYILAAKQIKEIKKILDKG